MGGPDARRQYSSPRRPRSPRSPPRCTGATACVVPLPPGKKRESLLLAPSHRPHRRDGYYRALKHRKSPWCALRKSNMYVLYGPRCCMRESQGPRTLKPPSIRRPKINITGAQCWVTGCESKLQFKFKLIIDLHISISKTWRIYRYLMDSTLT
jgi:hypothetical protein